MYGIHQENDLGLNTGLSPTVMGSSDTVILWEKFCWVHLSLYNCHCISVHINIILTDHIYPMMKHFYLYGSGLFQNVSTQRARAH